MDELSIDKLYFVYRSVILANRKTLVIYEGDVYFLVFGPKIAKQMKPYFIVVSKNDFQIVGFYTSEDENDTKIEKLKNVVTRMTTCVGKDGCKFTEALIHDINRRINTQSAPDTNDDDKFINEEIVIDTLRNSTRFVTI